MGVVANLFYSDMGYTLNQIATISKFWGLIATIFGGILGGILASRYNNYSILLLGAILAATTNILFAILAAYASFRNELGPTSAMLNKWSTKRQEKKFPIENISALNALITDVKEKQQMIISGSTAEGEEEEIERQAQHTLIPGCG